MDTFTSEQIADARQIVEETVIKMRAGLACARQSQVILAATTLIKSRPQLNAALELLIKARPEETVKWLAPMDELFVALENRLMEASGSQQGEASPS
jgi:hypothetical protein